MKRKFNAGFTLIEVLVTVTVIAIIAAIAIPSYNQYIIKARRVDARSVLTKLLADAEQFRTMNNRYPTPNEIPNPQPTYYSITAYPCASGGDCIEIEANARTGSSQEKDTLCRRMKVDTQGNLTPNNTECWPR